MNIPYISAEEVRKIFRWKMRSNAQRMFIS